MLLLDGPITFREAMANEPTPLAFVFREVLLFLAHRGDVVLFGSHAVNAYVDDERLTQDIDILALRGARLAEEIRDLLAGKFHIATRVREAVPGIGCRVYELRKPKNRHLVDVRQVAQLPTAVDVEGVPVLNPPELVAMKVLGMAERLGRPKAGTDRVDIQRLLLRFPELKSVEGVVSERLRELGASPTTLELWEGVATEPLEPDRDDY